ncbi:hypothetical protein NMG60_11034062 [Bertholletia excelsa]
MTWPGLSSTKLSSGPKICSKNLSQGMEEDSAEGNELCNAVLRYLNQALMEDDLEDKAWMIQVSTLHAVEKSLYEILNKKSPPSPSQYLSHVETSGRSDDNFIGVNASNLVGSGAISFPQDSFDVQNDSVNPCPLLCCLPDGMESSVANVLLENQSSWQFGRWVDENDNIPRGVSEFINFKNNTMTTPKSGEKRLEVEAKEGNLPDGLQRGQKSLHWEENDVEGRSNKHLASHPDDSALHELFDKVLSLYRGTNESGGECQKIEVAQRSDIEMLYTKRGPTRREALDMRNLLLKCMQSVADNNTVTASTLLKQIRSRSSPLGDGCQRLAHYFANGLEARLLGTGSPEYKAVGERFTSGAEILKSYKMYLSALPFMETAYFFVTQMIMELVEKTTCIHIIHFGIMYGVQWPPLIERLSTRAGGPPKLRITGIDLPQAGLRPDSRVKEAGRRLASYCEKFNVPFEFNDIVRKWETLSIANMGIKKDELLVVICSYQLMHLLDDTIMEHSPRDTVLDLIRRINPDIFIHGITNGNYNSPFFTSRFREALFHFSSLFDMLDVNLSKDNHERMVFERESWGKEIVNVLASEGVERIERPETYKQWQNRMVRAGLRQLPLNREILKTLKARVKSRYHKDFFVDESSQWLLEGWKGRVIFAFSCWKAA